MFNLSGTLYILENVEAQRLKIGVTINRPEERLKDINRMWHGTKGICQVCSSRRLLLPNGRMPKHVFRGNHCYGSGEFSIESDLSLAFQELNILKLKLEKISGKSKGATSRRIKTLAKLIESNSTNSQLSGTWKMQNTFYIKSAYKVEKAVHKLLAKYLDSTAPFGEVFNCTTEEALDAVEAALTQYKE